MRTPRFCTYRDLLVWQKGIDLADLVYKASRQLPAEERYGLSSQMRRSAVSIPANIAEGAGRNSPREFLRHLFYSRGSLCELETQLTIASRSGMLPDRYEQTIRKKLDQVSRLLNGLIRSTRGRIDA